jgi:mannose-6-phosphate isomerase-like protein (cupin superfamily)
VESASLPDDPNHIAPDGCEVRVLLSVSGGGMAHFQLAGGETANAVVHRTVEEIWFFLTGRGEMWRDGVGVVEVVPGSCITIPVGTSFQVRSHGDDPLSAIGVTIPQWPGSGEAVPAHGPWTATVEPGPG